MSIPANQKTLYHYCSLQTFFNIIGNQSIWLSDISKSNDSQELNWIKKEFEVYSLGQWKEFINYHKENNIPVNFSTEEKIEEYCHSHLGLDKGMTNYWCFCLSELFDDLGQWRGYADDGKGIAIGFNQEMLQQIAEGLYGNFGSYAEFSRINYGTNEAKKYFDSIAEKNNFSPSLEYEIINNILLNETNDVIKKAGFYKNDCFQQEKEWRLLLYGSNFMGNIKAASFDLADNIKVNIKGIDYIPKNDGLVSHIEIEIIDIGKIIEEIVIGPKCKISKSEMTKYLQTKGISTIHRDKIQIHIIESGSSYR